MCGGGDNSEPLHHGFSTGFHLAFHGENNRALKSKLHRVYLQYCPPLAHGIFMSEEQIMVRSALTLSTQQSFFEDYDLHGQGARQLRQARHLRRLRHSSRRWTAGRLRMPPCASLGLRAQTYVQAVG